MMSTSVIELSLSALRSNLSFIRTLIGPQTRFCSVIKGNAYGHGISVFLPLAESLGVDTFAVFDAEEALVAHKAKTRQNTQLIIMGAMGAVPDDAMAWAIENDIQFYVFDQLRLNLACSLAKKLKRPARIHIEIETGLCRTGFEKNQLEEVLHTIKQAGPVLQLEGVCSHLAGAESIANYLRIQQQIERYQTLVQSFHRQGLRSACQHLACSAAIISYPQTHFDMIRCGIMQFGFRPSPETRMHYVLGRKDKDPNLQVRDPLRRVMKWKSWVMSIKEVPAGSFVGYGNAFLSTKRMKLAVVPIGYFHGYSRRLSNAGYVLIRGKRASVVGTVNMNMMMVDVTHLSLPEKGEEVVIIGKQQRNKITVRSFSEMSQYLTYEVLARLSSTIPRVVVD